MDSNMNLSSFIIIEWITCQKSTYRHETRISHINVVFQSLIKEKKKNMKENKERKEREGDGNIYCIFVFPGSNEMKGKWIVYVFLS